MYCSPTDDTTYKVYNVSATYPCCLGMRPCPMKIPTPKMAAQLTMTKTKPVITVADRATSILVTEYLAARAENPMPIPIKMLKTGPAKQAVIAMLLKFLRAIATLLLKSATELPHARMVKPIIGPGILSTIPIKSSIATRLSAIKSIHVAPIKKPYKAIGVAAKSAMLPSPAGANLSIKAPTMKAIKCKIPK